jgi:long-chain acyl-CoA synthetase
MNLMFILRRARDRYTNEPAILDTSGSITWREFYQRVERSAAFLRTSGLDRGDRLAVLLSNSPEYLELLYATAMAGIIVVPLNNRWGLDDFVFSINDSGSRALVVDHRFAGTGRQIRARVPELKLVWAGRGECPDDMTDYSAEVPLVLEWPEPAPEDIAGLFYTSGTTGGPKGVMLTHRNLYSNALLMMASGVGVGKVYLHAAPMFHLADGAATHISTFSGTTHCFLETFDPAGVLESIANYRVTTVLLVPTMINMVVNHPLVDSTDLSSLERVLYGASPMPVPLLELAMRKLRCAFYQAYGMTELSPVVTVLRAEDHRLENLDSTFTPVRSAGRPVAGMEIRVVDINDCDVPVGRVGEIIARGDNVMKGYWNRPDITAEILRGGWMHTGDLGAFDERGYLYILDRMKDMIKTGGENVYSPEVESMLVSHADVLEAAVIGVVDERWGETIRAVVVLRPGSACTEAGIIGYCRERMTHFKCPASVVFVDALPKGGTGKVQKTILRKLYAGQSTAARA